MAAGKESARDSGDMDVEKDIEDKLGRKKIDVAILQKDKEKIK